MNELDFDEKANKLLSIIEKSDCPMIQFDKIKSALKKEYEQGLNKGWQHELEHDVEWQRKAVQLPYQCVHGVDWRSVYPCKQCGV